MPGRKPEELRCTDVDCKLGPACLGNRYELLSNGAVQLVAPHHKNVSLISLRGFCTVCVCTRAGGPLLWVVGECGGW